MQMKKAGSETVSWLDSFMVSFCLFVFIDTFVQKRRRQIFNINPKSIAPVQLVAAETTAASGSSRQLL